MKRILHCIPQSYQKAIVDLTQEGLVGWDVELVRKDNHSGSLQLTIGSDNKEFSKIHMMRSELVVMEGDREVWRGRVTDQKPVQHWQKRIICAGLMDYLYDAVIPPQKLEGPAENVLSLVLQMFNASKIEAHKRFFMGVVSGIGDISYEFKQPMKCFDLFSKLVGEYGGSLKARRDGEKNMLDWRGEGRAFRQTCSQSVTFGQNLTKLEITDDGDGLATALYGYGKDGLWCYVEDAEAVEQFGRIEDVVNFSDVVSEDELRSRTQNELNERIKKVRSFTASAIDLSSVDASVEPFEEGCYVYLRSQPHDIDEPVLIEEISDRLFAPSKTRIVLGAPTMSASSIMRRLL